MPETVGMISLGCPKNQVDAEIMLSSLKREGFHITSDAAQADAIIVNTCGFIEDAKKESIENILEAAGLKTTGRLRALVVTGCMAERYRDQIAEEMPEVDAVVGIGANAQIGDILRGALAGETVARYADKGCLPLSGARILTTPSHYAYLRVADGCDNRCSYCAIPGIRGAFRSRPVDSIVEEAAELAAAGVRELVLVAQDTTRYGLDLTGRLMLPGLLKELCGVSGVEWIRLLYCYPDCVTGELLAVIKNEPGVLPYMDMPLQHVNGNVLRAMNRRGDAASLMALIRRMRAAVPGLTLRTTVMVGFPGEDEAAFTELCAFVEAAAFEHLGCFTYSPEEDTPAAEMENQVDPEVKARRQEIVMTLQAGIVSRRLDAMLGRTVRVMVDGAEGDRAEGRTAADAPEIDGRVLFASGRPVHPGEMVDVRVTGHTDYDLTGELINGADGR